MAKTKTKVTKKIAKATDGKYEISVTICGQTLTTKTDDIKGAILSLKPKKISGKILFNIKKGDKTIERVMLPFQARKLFINELMAEFFTKNIMLRFK